MESSEETDRMLPGQLPLKSQNAPQIVRSCSSFNCIIVCGFVFTFFLSFVWLFFGMESTSLSVRQNLIRWQNLARPSLSPQKKSSRKATFTNSPRILCWVMTQPANHLRKAIHVQNTWITRCDKFLFMTTASSVNTDDHRLRNVVVLNNTVKSDEFSTRKYLWGRTKQAFRYCYDHFLHDYDWFMKADDDTYVIVENLRHMVASVNASEPWYFARMVMGSLSGGAGYVLSRAALRQFIEDGLTSSPSALSAPPADGGGMRSAGEEGNYCHRLDDTHADDLQMHICLQALNIREANATDAAGKGKMWNFPLMPRTLRGELYFHYWNSHLDPKPPQLANISRYVVSFHHVTPSAMYTYDYLLYHINVFGETLTEKDKA